MVTFFWYGIIPLKLKTMKKDSWLDKMFWVLVSSNWCIRAWEIYGAVLTMRQGEEGSHVWMAFKGKHSWRTELWGNAHRNIYHLVGDIGWEEMLVLGAQIHFLEEGKTSQTGQNRRVFYFFWITRDDGFRMLEGSELKPTDLKKLDRGSHDS